jgi:hypothetical protein
MTFGTRSCTTQNVGHPFMCGTGPWMRGMGTWHHPFFTGPPIYFNKIRSGPVHETLPLALAQSLTNVMILNIFLS